MGAPGIDVIKWGPERARAGPWRGERDTALLTLLTDAPVPSTAFVRRCLDVLGQRGYRRVMTGALSPAEAASFLAAGFDVSERLYLLRHDLSAIPDTGRVGHRRAGWRDEPHVLGLDRLAFPSFWQLDTASLREAVDATPRTRYRVVGGAEPAPRPAVAVAYVITGRSGRRGYLQRLAVHPDHRGMGLGSALVADGLRWLRRWRAEQAVVNTQLDNSRALALYERLGFTRQHHGLSVLSASIG